VTHSRTSSAARSAGVGTGKPAWTAESLAAAGGRMAIRGLRFRRDDSVIRGKIAAPPADHNPNN
jgi:hypothetical protein